MFPIFRLIGIKSPWPLGEYETLLAILFIVKPKLYAASFPPTFKSSLRYIIEISAPPAIPAFVWAPATICPPVKLEYTNLPFNPILKLSVSLKA